MKPRTWITLASYLALGATTVNSQQASPSPESDAGKRVTLPGLSPNKNYSDTKPGDIDPDTKKTKTDYLFFEDDQEDHFSPDYGYNKYYSFTSYPTGTGYINPAYEYPGRDDIDPKETVDEAMRKYIVEGGQSMEEVLKMFYPEQYDVFWEMDQVADPKTGKLHPLNMDRRGVMGRNTWILWCGGNEWFWDWLATDGVALIDFLHLLDSRQREHRFASAGLWNQPGMEKNSAPGPWGLYLDKLVRPMTDRNGKKLKSYSDSLGDGQNRIVSDGVDPKIYGYPSGVIGFRLFPNPNFDAEAEEKWDAEAFYSDRNYRSNPDLERPLRVGMSCALCHVAAHPLNPPADPAEPEWENLSALIGNQYFRTSAILGNQTHPTNFLNQFLANQQPGTVDTSMTSTDWINNSNAMNAVFEFQARMHRTLRNPPESQPERALNLALPFGEGKDPRRFPRVLMEGADSIGAWGALARVYLNIGLFGEQWNNVQNTIIGVPPRRPFQLDTLHTNSVNWNVNEAYRIHYMAFYFDHRIVRDPESGKMSISDDPGTIYDPDLEFVESSTQAMHLKNALVKERRFEEHPKLVEKHIAPELVGKGKEVFTANCMICHSSRQPEGYGLAFANQPPGGDDWSEVTTAEDGALVLPNSLKHWEKFKESPAYLGYLAKAGRLVEAEDDFFTSENFLSNELRIPVSLVGTNSQRALGENALEGEVWADFSSKDYKNLDRVGRISYFDAINKKNESFQPEGGGRGFYRPPTLVSVWATAPLLHNNALGSYLPDHLGSERVSVEGRLEMFDNAIEKLLWKDLRSLSPSGEGGLRNEGDSTWRGEDPGWIYRTTLSTYFKIEAPQIRGMIERSIEHIGLSANFLLFFVGHPWIIPLVLALIVGLLVWKRRRWTAYLAIAAGLLLLLALFVAGLRHLVPFWGSLLALVILLAGLATLTGLRYQTRDKIAKMKSMGKEITRKDLFFASPVSSLLAPGALFLLCLVLFGGLTFGKLLINGDAGDLKLGPFPKGMPVSSFMNMDLDASPLKLAGAVRGMLRSFRAVKTIQSNQKLSADKIQEKALAAFNRYAGPGLLAVSKCPDWELDRGHYFGEALSDDEKRQLIAFLKTL